MHEGRPRISLERAAQHAAAEYGIEASASALPSYADQNVLLTTAGGARHVLRIANADEPAEVSDLQARALLHLRTGDGPRLQLPEPLPTRSGALVGSLAHDGRTHATRLSTFVPGLPLSQHRPREPELLRATGRALGRLDRHLASFEHPAADRALEWRIERAAEVTRANLGAVADAAHRALLERTVARCETMLTGLSLPRQVIQNDANDDNLLVRFASAAPMPGDRPEPAGLIDFGDLVRSHRCAELAIACAYLMLGEADPVGAACELAAGYDLEHPLTDDELRAIHPLALLRLCQSVTLASRNAAHEPDNGHLVVSQAPALALLEQLDGHSLASASLRIRHATGASVHPDAVAVVGWLRERRGHFAPVLDAARMALPHEVLDFSVGSTEWEHLPAGAGMTEAVTHEIGRRLQRRGAGFAVGRYDEARLVYEGEGYRVGGGARPGDRRSVHLGVDLFAPAGTTVHAPLDATVHAVAHNDAPLDYGPTVILAHDADGRVFYTLYGHLDLDSLQRVRPGQKLAAGERLGAIGAPPDNGGWSPHLHFQLMLDLLDYEGDFPGVAPPDERPVWLGLCPDPDLILGLDLPRGDGRPARSTLTAQRRRHLGPMLSLSYREPLEILRGRGQYLYDELGRRYLDCVNNVPHVGHGHPRVVEAGARQMAVLNTNTRYLHPLIGEYAQRLCATLPAELTVCFFVNSGSEANELALRLARTHTGRRDLVVLEGGYHGNTGTLAAMSPYKYDGPGGRGAPPWAHAAPMPDTFRGRFRDPDDATPWLEQLEGMAGGLCERDQPPAALIAESILSCGGQVVPPPGYLRGAFECVRRHGGVAIADEVQVGFGRVGSHMWAFEAQGARPDIVTLGKPMGNGHPLGAVITTAEIASSFDTGMEYFNTFGGNPVSCAIGLAVLDVIEQEGLRERAAVVGQLLLDGFAELARRHPLIADVRGRGLFLGLELCTGGEARMPAPSHARHVVERMKAHGILLSTDGPEHDVIKMKPPLCFSEADAEHLLHTLDRVLAETTLRLR